MPPTYRNGPELGTQDRPDASSAITATSITRRPVKGRRRRAARRREQYPRADASLYEPVRGRGLEWLSIRCPYCAGVHLGRLRPGTEPGRPEAHPVRPCLRRSAEDLPQPDDLGSSSVTLAQWRLAGRVEELLRREGDLTDSVLVAILGADPRELRAVTGMLYRAKRADRCGDDLVVVPRQHEGRCAA
jgi:hypothetical protein